MANVDYKREDYREALPGWQVCADATSDMLSDKMRTRHLPQPNPEDKSKENKERYKQYKQRATWYGFTSRTLAGMVGAAFRKDPTIKLPTVIDYATTDIDSEGVGLVQQAQRTLAGVLKKGRQGLYVDFPENEGEISRATLVAQAMRPFVRSIDAEDIINWRTEQVGGRTVLTLVVIAETHEEQDDFGSTCIPQRRVLRLTAGVYSVELWRKEAGSDWTLAQGPIVPRKADGTTFDHILFYFVGSENNDSSIDPAPLLDLAQLNLSHFRNSADYEDACYIVGQPMAYMAGLDEQWVKMLDEKGLYLGSRAILPLPAGGTAGIMQPAPNTMPMEAMKHKEAQAVALGARLIEQNGAAKTATQSSGEQNVQHSVLSLCVKNTTEAYLAAIEAMLEFAGGAGQSVEFMISTEFVELRLEPQMLTALIQAWQSGKFPETDLWAQLRKYGVIDPSKTDEDIKDELEATAPTGPTLDPIGKGGAGDKLPADDKQQPGKPKRKIRLVREGDGSVTAEEM